MWVEVECFGRDYTFVVSLDDEDLIEHSDVSVHVELELCVTLSLRLEQASLLFCVEHDDFVLLTEDAFRDYAQNHGHTVGGRCNFMLDQSLSGV